jgi:hypothetical protein
MSVLVQADLRVEPTSFNVSVAANLERCQRLDIVSKPAVLSKHTYKRIIDPLFRMALLEQAERNAIASRLLQELESTRFACSCLEELNGGTLNFTFRGLLKEPISSLDGTMAAKTVIVKHSTDFAAVNKDFPIPISRSVILPLIKST